MAEFPPNLDDGEVWLPSDIFVNEVPNRFTTHHHHLSCMDDLALAQRFAAFTFLQTHRNVSKPHLNNPSPNSNSERFGPAVRYGRAPQEQDYYYLSLNGSRTGSAFHGHNQLMEPPQPQGVGNLRARVLRSQQNRVQNRHLPFQGTSGFGSGGFVKESGGTGVFHPRILNTTANSTTTSDSRRKQALRNSQEIQVTQQGSYHKGNIGVGKQRESHHYLPPEMVLPQDWTY
ncbi:hypothetical protein FCV25MIE_20614 [Fagus crenata]